MVPRVNVYVVLYAVNFVWGGGGRKKRPSQLCPPQWVPLAPFYTGTPSPPELWARGRGDCTCHLASPASVPTTSPLRQSFFLLKTCHFQATFSGPSVALQCLSVEGEPCAIPKYASLGILVTLGWLTSGNGGRGRSLGNQADIPFLKDIHLCKGDLFARTLLSPQKRKVCESLGTVISGGRGSNLPNSPR